MESSAKHPNRWMQFYQGRDREKYARLRRAFDRAGIRYQADEFDMLSRLRTQSMTNMSQRSPRSIGTYSVGNPELVQLKQMGGEENNLYTLMVRGRDLAAARQAEFSLDREPEPRPAAEADLSVLKAPLTQAAPLPEREKARLEKTDRLWGGVAMILTLLGILAVVVFVLCQLDGGVYGFFYPGEHMGTALLLGLCSLPVGLLLHALRAAYVYYKQR